MGEPLALEAMARRPPAGGRTLQNAASCGPPARGLMPPDWGRPSRAHRVRVSLGSGAIFAPRSDDSLQPAAIHGTGGAVIPSNQRPLPRAWPRSTARWANGSAAAHATMTPVLGGRLACRAGGGVSRLEPGSEMGTRHGGWEPGQDRPPNRHPCQKRIRLAAKGFGENAGTRKGLDAQKYRNHDEMVNLGYSG